MVIVEFYPWTLFLQEYLQMKFVIVGFPGGRMTWWVLFHHMECMKGTSQ